MSTISATWPAMAAHCPALVNVLNELRFEIDTGSYDDNALAEMYQEYSDSIAIFVGPKAPDWKMASEEHAAVADAKLREVLELSSAEGRVA